MFCPKCGEQFKRSHTSCPDCGVALVEQFDEDIYSPVILEEAEKRRKVSGCLLFGGLSLIGLGLQGLLTAGSMSFRNDGIISLVVIIPGWLALIAAAAFYARSKGYEWYYGALGLLGVIGLIILLRLPDKVRNPAP
ncbi:MAG: hypothetical protein ABIR47_16395 [Candidatus Kapaibacterium sp.]